jgi:CRP/FNR family transcriptional regulator, cyclic AMP receptor protein
LSVGLSIKDVGLPDANKRWTMNWIMSSGTATPSKLAANSAIIEEAALSGALQTIFRGKFCNILLSGRTPLRFRAGDVLYDVGDLSRSMFFIQKGYVKVGTLTADGREIIYDIRKEGDVVGELCAARVPRCDRAVALESLEAIDVPYVEVLSALGTHPELLAKLIEVFCTCLADAYDQITNLTARDLTGRVAQLLVSLGAKLGSLNTEPVMIPAYLTQEEIAQMVGGRRERVSTVLNSLRRRGLIEYSSRGHLVLYVAALRNLLT